MRTSVRGFTSGGVGPEQARSGEAWTGPALLLPLWSEKPSLEHIPSDKRVGEELPVMKGTVRSYDQACEEM